jgi:protein-S-isoprenylcysteine O-methyltransferase Ste14/uncharacterized membrane protein (UPF0127 family)
MIVNQENQANYPIRVLRARSLIARLVGLLGTHTPPRESALLLQPCHGIHTFAMNYPIDVLFLDKTGRIVQIIHGLKPNAVAKARTGTDSVLELAPGTAEACHFRIGQRLDIRSDEAHTPSAVSLRNLFHWPVNIAISLFWCKFVLIAGGYAIAHPHPMHFGILIHNTLLMFFFLTRRKSTQTSFRFFDWIIPVLTLISALLLRPVTAAPGLNFLSILCQYSGLTGIIFSLLSLGRSFGFIPANRRIISHGAYRIVRHPLYMSEILFYTGFFVGNFSVQNGLLIALILAGQCLRSLSEERLLSADAVYRTYRQQVRYRFIPGLF